MAFPVKHFAIFTMLTVGQIFVYGLLSDLTYESSRLTGFAYPSREILDILTSGPRESDRQPYLGQTVVRQTKILFYIKEYNLLHCHSLISSAPGVTLPRSTTSLPRMDTS